MASAGIHIGCDVEAVEPRSPSFAADYFTAGEQRLVEQTPPAGRDLLLTLLWSAKESALKALGCGLCADTRSVNAAPEGFGDPTWGRLSVGHSGGVFHGWWREVDGLVRTVLAEPAAVHLAALSRLGFQKLHRRLGEPGDPGDTDTLRAALPLSAHRPVEGGAAQQRAAHARTAGEN